MFLKSKIFRVQKMTWLDTSACFIRTSQSWKLIPSKLEKNPNHFNPKKNVYIITACFSKDQLVQMIFGVTQCNSIGIVFHVWPSKFERTKLLNFKTKDFACHKKKNIKTRSYFHVPHLPLFPQLEPQGFYPEPKNYPKGGYEFWSWAQNTFPKGRFGF